MGSIVETRIAKMTGVATDTSRDHEYTAWLALDGFIDQIAVEMAAA